MQDNVFYLSDYHEIPTPEPLDGESYGDHKTRLRGQARFNQLMDNFRKTEEAGK
jgi:hypothetical protein